MFFLIFSPDTSTLSPESWALSHRTCNQSDRGEIEQLNVHKEYLIMLLVISKPQERLLLLVQTLLRSSSWRR